MSDTYGIYIAGPNEKAAKVYKEAVMEVLNAKADQKTIRLALEILGKTFETQPTHISNCSIEMGKK